MYIRLSEDSLLICKRLDLFDIKNKCILIFLYMHHNIPCLSPTTTPNRFLEARHRNDSLYSYVHHRIRVLLPLCVDSFCLFNSAIFHILLWLARIYSINYIPKSSSVREIMQLAKNSAWGVSCTSIIMVCSVLVAEWH